MSDQDKTCFDQSHFAQLVKGEIDLIVASEPDGRKRTGFGDSLIFPGAFNPLHAAHLAMADLAARRADRPVWFEISVENVDKDALAFEDVLQRASQPHTPHGLVLTHVPKFEDKSHLFAGCIFVVGADTISRINDLRYYDDSVTKRSQSFAIIAANGCRFMVFTRKHFNIETGTSNCQFGGPLDSELGQLCDFVSPIDFSMEISSTDIRNRQGD